MADIASIDRRLDNVEQAVSLTLVEQDLNNLVIPSSLNTDIARFKFGFAVDNFDELRLADIANPQFNASIFEGKLSPLKKRLVVSYIEETGTQTVTLPRAADFVLIDQDIATQGPVVLPEPPLPPMPVDPIVKDPPSPPAPPPRPPITLETEGDVAHVCGLVPGTVVIITVRHPLTRDIYMQVTRTASAEGCVEAPLIYTPPVAPNDPVICPQPPTVPGPGPVIVVTPDPPVTPVDPLPPIIETPIDSGGGGGDYNDYALIAPYYRTDVFRWLEGRGTIGNASNIEQSLGITGP